MAFSVPLLLEKSIAVVHRLNVPATASLHPYSGQSTGYDKDFREPITFDARRQGKTIRDNARSEYPAVRIPCQVEMNRFERLNQQPPGDAQQSGIQLVFHRLDLKRLKLFNTTSKEPLIKRNDRVSAIESPKHPGTPTVPIEPPGLFITEVQPASFGFGVDGTDLFIAYLLNREVAV